MYERMLQYLCCCEGGDCFCMNDCYNKVVFVKVASVSDLDSAETFQISRILGLDIDENVCLLDSQLCACMQEDGMNVFRQRELT